MPEPALLHPDHEGPAMSPRYSPDGKRIVYGIQREIGFYADPVRLVAYDRTSGQHVVLTDGWDNSADAWCFGEDPDTLYLAAQDGARGALWSLNLGAALADPDANPPRQIALGGWLGAPRPAAGRLFCTFESLTQPPEAVAVDVQSGAVTRLSDFCGPLMTELSLGQTEEIFFEGAEGDQVQMFLVHPPEAPAGSAAKAVAGRSAGQSADGSTDGSAGDRPTRASEPDRLPLVHLVHGGPHGVFGDQWHWRWNAHAFAAPGHRVALVNFHGSTGFGEAYTRSILGQWGARPAADVLAATDLLIQRGLVDPARMAIAGGSYGGYLVSWLAGITDRFACIVNHAGVSDFQTQFASDITQGRRKSMGGELWENLEGLDRFNPIRQSAAFQSPMLVLHGMRDYRVPYNQGLAIYNVYKARGLPARLVVYPDENHWILKPQNSQHWYGEVLGWIARWFEAAGE
jgi:dipeptidyl aminopeptidase/acylaminoacyl peptidase